MNYNTQKRVAILKLNKPIKTHSSTKLQRFIICVRKCGLPSINENIIIIFIIIIIIIIITGYTQDAIFESDLAKLNIITTSSKMIFCF